MQLLTKELREKLPELYANEAEDPKDIPIIVKFFTPWTQWTWFATEFDGEDQFFGYVKGLENELGYFSLSEMQAIQGPFGLRIERDRHFGNHSLEEVMAGKAN